MTDLPTARSDRRGTAWRLEVALRLEPDGPEVGREPVTDTDLMDVRGEVWLEGFLSRGRQDVPFDDVDLRLEPIFSREGLSCTGYIAMVANPDLTDLHRRFSPRSLEHVATRAAERLVVEGLRRPDAPYYYEIKAAREPANPAVDVTGWRPSAPFTTETHVEPLSLLSTPIAPLRQQARPVDSPGDDDGRCRVFYTEAALAQAEKVARKGAACHPPVETGGVLVGPLCVCPDTGDLFMVVREIIEAADAEQTKFSLNYSGKTWAGIQTVIRARHRHPATCADRILGQAHGHNFVPFDGAEPCEACPTLAVCGRSSVFVSWDDLTWNRAVFRRQPWSLCHIFGLNARQEEVHGLFGLRDGRLLQRGFHVIPEFEVNHS